jgi:hypothetical protein
MLDGLTSDKDLISSQITRKCEEIELLNQKINMMQMALDRSNSQYNDRLEDIKFLKIEIKNLRSQRNLLARGSANTAGWYMIECLKCFSNFINQKILNLSSSIFCKNKYLSVIMSLFLDLRQEVLQLNRVLVQERVRARALENEMTTPMNLHR